MRRVSVFLSYNSANKDFVKRVATRMFASRLRPWLDVWEMGPGDPLRQTLEQAIERCDCFVLFWSEESKVAPWVEWERQNAGRLVNKRRVCVRLADIVPPPELSQRIWLDWIDWRAEEAFEPKLQILLRSIYGRPLEVRPVAAPGRRPPSANAARPGRKRFTRPHFDRMNQLLADRYGEQNWWERDDKFQLCVEAILAQGTSWRNVGLAIRNLSAQGVLTPMGLSAIPEENLRGLIRICGRAQAKARYIKGLVRLMERGYEWDVNRMLTDDTVSLRRSLLEVDGIGDFTADNILLYAANRPKLPINDRMRKVLYEHRFIDRLDTYETVQARMEMALPGDTHRIKEFDAMIYRVAREHCHPKPLCQDCPLRPTLPASGPRSRAVGAS